MDNSDTDNTAYAIGQQLTRVLTVIVISGALLSLLGGIIIVFLRNRESRRRPFARTTTIELERVSNKSQLLSREKLDTFPVIVFKVESHVVQSVTIENGENEKNCTSNIEKNDSNINTNENSNGTTTDNAQTNNTTIPTANREPSVPSSPTHEVSQARENELTSCIKNEKNDNDEGGDNENVVEEDKRDKRYANESHHVDFPTTCVICLEDFQDGDELRQLPCFHQYHIKCIDPWLMQKSSVCPMCKHDCNRRFIPFKKNGNSSNRDTIGDSDISTVSTTTSATFSFFTITASSPTAAIRQHDIDITVSQENNESRDVNSRPSLQLSLTISSTDSHPQSQWSWSSSRSSKSVSTIEPSEVVIDRVRGVSSDIGDESNKGEEVNITDLTSWAVECYNSYGDVWEVYTELSRDIWISRGDLMIDVMLGDRYKLRFPTANYAYMKLGPGDKGIGFNNRLENWEMTRDVVDSVMKSEGFLDEVVKWTEEYYRFIEKERGGIINGMHDYKQLVENVAVKVLTGINPIESDQMLDDLDHWINERGYITNIKDIIIELWQSLANGKLSQRTYEGLPPMHGLAQKVLGRWDAIKSCPAEQLITNDLLTKLRVANTVLDNKKSTMDDVGRPFSPTEITVILTEMLIGGIYKILPVIKNLMAALEKDPSLITPLTEELTATFGNTLPTNLTAASLSSLPYCDALISETIRLNTPVPIITRTAAQPVNLRAKAWPTGTTVKLVVNSLLMNQRSWKNPEKFNPERFLELESSAEKNRKEVISFGNGPRACPGREMTMCLLKTFLVLRFWDSNNIIIEGIRDVKGVRDVDVLNFSRLY
ncbi:8148_t:CDS:2 [Paraglomus occultum]|uniref:8148_t:CDS:1 n=1 Tax=Paraglomus occultum TaxID=144539 RepID=A0A9N8WGA6_9GLOM|nr:8148_t:CDS:2 [Paraglomus occultum]